MPPKIPSDDNEESKMRLLLIILLCLIGGTAILVNLISPEVFPRAFIIIVPSIGAVLWSMVMRGKVTFRWTDGEAGPRDPFRFFVITASLFAIVMLTSTALRLESAERNLIYFGLQGIAVLLISYQVVLVAAYSRSRVLSLVLLEIGIFVSMEVLLKTLPLEYYFGNPDIMWHESTVQRIMSLYHVGPFMSSYEYFPLMHVLSATLSEIAPVLDSARAIFLLFGVCGFMVPFVLFSISMQVFKNAGFSLIVSFLGSTGYSILDYLSAGMPFVLSFIFFLFILFLSLRLRFRSRFAPVGCVFIVALILTHQVSVAFAFVYLVVAQLVACHYQGVERRNCYLGLSLAFVMLIAYVGYSAFGPIVFYHGVFLGFEPTGAISMPTALSSESILMFYFARRSPFSMLLFFAFLGILYTAGLSSSSRRIGGRISVTLLGVVAMFFYLPGFSRIIWVIDEYIAHGSRLTPFAEQVTMLFVAAGLLIARIRSSPFRNGILSALVPVIVIGALVSQANTDDTSVFLDYDDPRPDAYFVGEDLYGFQFLKSFARNQVIWSDGDSNSYLIRHGMQSDTPHVSSNNSIAFPSESIVYLRAAELQTNGLNFFVAEQPSAFYPGYQSLRTSSLESFTRQADVIMDSGRDLIVICPENLWILGQ